MRGWLPALVPAAAGLLLGCGPGHGPRRIERTRIVESPWPGGLRPRTPAARFGFERQPAPHEPAAAEPPSFGYDLPPGWKRLAPRMFRAINLRAGSDPGAECYLTVLARGGGGIARNVNRWRGQMGLGPLGEEAVAKLPRRKLAGLAGTEAVLVELAGTYTPMGGSAALPGHEFLGVIFVHRGSGVFVRMVGPKEVVDRERGHFEAFLDSLTDTTAESGAAPAPGRLAWDVPAGWRLGPKRAMREVTLLPAAGGRTECYLSRAGGGLSANVNRWRRQMGQGELGAAEIDGLAKIDVLGHEGRILEVAGDYAGMGGATLRGALLVGVIVPGAGLFAKMIGPAKDVRSHRDEFLAFVASLRVER